MMTYDYLIVGAGLFGCVCAHELHSAGKTCKVIDRRSHIAGNIYTEKQNGIQVHRYGAHIFHTSDREVWEYVNEYAEFNNYINSPIARYHNELYNLPFNMNTFSKMWGVVTPAEAKAVIAKQVQEAGITNPQNLEEQALSLAGRDIYEKLIKEYTQKQWGRPCTELPAFIIKRLPFRFVYDNNYFNDRYQGIPVGGYTQIAEKLLADVPVELNKDFLTSASEIQIENQSYYEMDGDLFRSVIYTGMIDAFFRYQYGPLEYRSLKFETEVLPDCDNYQGNAVVNYTSADVPFTRIIEHKHFEFGKDSETGEPIPGTIITREYPVSWQKGMEPYYPVNNEKNAALYEKYKALAAEKSNVIFGGRLGMYKYFDMDKVIRAALDTVNTLV
ncbi:MAG: UDP-galactopyranose mutase [Lachnospiraceae bacterium]